jgi:D-cysteine desulfhydrase
MTDPSTPSRSAPSIELARLPTPVQPLEQLSEQLGVQILCKRDDLTGVELSGNKVRKLEYLLADALDRDSSCVITCGGQQSNHARATALAGARVGLHPHLLLRTADPSAPPTAQGNILLDRLAGATIEWITPEAYGQRDSLMTEAAERLQARTGERCYVIPEGGSNALGAWGYVRCAEELLQQLGRVPATIVHAVGSGGTSAGLHAACRLLQLPYRLIGVCVADDRHSFQRRISDIVTQMADRWQLDLTVDAEEIEIWDNYVGRGYALSRTEELQTIIELARSEGLVLDPVYSGKAMHGLLEELRGGRALAEPIVFLHTGGIFGLEAASDQLLPLL